MGGGGAPVHECMTERRRRRRERWTERKRLADIPNWRVGSRSRAELCASSRALAELSCLTDLGRAPEGSGKRLLRNPALQKRPRQGKGGHFLSTLFLAICVDNHIKGLMHGCAAPHPPHEAGGRTLAQRTPAAQLLSWWSRRIRISTQFSQSSGQFSTVSLPLPRISFGPFRPDGCHS